MCVFQHPRPFLSHVSRTINNIKTLLKFVGVAESFKCYNRFKGVYAYIKGRWKPMNLKGDQEANKRIIIHFLGQLEIRKIYNPLEPKQ